MVNKQNFFGIIICPDGWAAFDITIITITNICIISLLEENQILLEFPSTLFLCYWGRPFTPSFFGCLASEISAQYFTCWHDRVNKIFKYSSETINMKYCNDQKWALLSKNISKFLLDQARPRVQSCEKKELSLSKFSISIPVKRHYLDA